MANAPIPSPQHPMMDLRTGKIDPVWYRYLKDLERRLAAQEAS